MIKSFKIMLLFAAVAVLGATGTSAYAQQGAPGNAPSAEKREQIRKKIETIKIWRLTEALKLDAATGAKLASFLSSFDQQRRDNMRERRETMRELRLLLKTRKPDTAKIQPLLDKLESNHRANQELIDKEWKGLREMLTPEQQARYVVFQHDFRHEMQKMIAGARGGGPAKGMGPGGARGQGPGPGAGRPQPGTPQNNP